MNQTVTVAPAVVKSGTLGSIKVEPLTCTIGALLGNVNLGVASRSPELVAEIRALLLKHKVLFFRDQDITRAEHVTFARHFGELEDHPVAGSEPDNPGLVRIWAGLLVVLVAQAILGEVQYRNALPWGLVLVHVALAASIWAFSLVLAFTLWRPPAPLTRK